MFRLVQANQLLRPGLFLKVRSNNRLHIANANTLNTPPQAYIHPAANANSQFTRNNATSATPLALSGSGATGTGSFLSPTTSRLETFISQNQQTESADHEEALKKEAFGKRSYLRNLFTEFEHMRDSRANPRALVDLGSKIIRLVSDPEITSVITVHDLNQLGGVLNVTMFQQRSARLGNSKNRDSDEKGEQFGIESALQQGTLDLAHRIMNGEYNQLLSAPFLTRVMFTLQQLRYYQEAVNLWEHGINDPEVGSLYLDHKVLASVLFMAYEIKRFSYDDVLRIYEVNTKDTKIIHYDLRATVGKICILSGDYATALDHLESMLQVYEESKRVKRPFLDAIRDLHLCFIGMCKDVRIAKHFFDKVINRDLPYDVRLKVPHIVGLLHNCYETGEPIDSILYFYQNTLANYSEDEKNGKAKRINASYAQLNNTIFNIFFQLYPSLNQDAFEKLKEVMTIYAQYAPIDEVLLNTIITNYSWNDKEVLEQLIANYDYYRVDRTPVSYRICLKKVGSVGNYSLEEIVAKWNQSLQKLDADGYRYIPIADWAAIRDATILSDKYSAERKELYMHILNRYKDYFQDAQSINRFLKVWSRYSDHYRDIVVLTRGNGDGYAYEVPQLRNLKPGINFKDVSARAAESFGH